MSDKISFDTVKDSGERHDYGTGSVRDTRKGKGRFDLVSPIALRRLAKHLENGAEKYDRRNWELGQPLSDYFDSAVRHMYDFLEGKRDEDHLSAAMWNIHCLIHTEEMINRGLLPEELSDLPSYINKEITLKDIEKYKKALEGEIEEGFVLEPMVGKVDLES